MEWCSHDDDAPRSVAASDASVTADGAEAHAPPDGARGGGRDEGERSSRDRESHGPMAGRPRAVRKGAVERTVQRHVAAVGLDPRGREDPLHGSGRRCRARFPEERHDEKERNEGRGRRGEGRPPASREEKGARGEQAERLEGDREPEQRAARPLEPAVQPLAGENEEEEDERVRLEVPLRRGEGREDESENEDRGPSRAPRARRSPRARRPTRPPTAIPPPGREERERDEGEREERRVEIGVHARVRIVAGSQGRRGLEVGPDVGPASREERLGGERQCGREDRKDEQPRAGVRHGALREPASPGST